MNEEPQELECRDSQTDPDKWPCSGIIMRRPDGEFRCTAHENDRLTVAAAVTQYQVQEVNPDGAPIHETKYDDRADAETFARKYLDAYPFVIYCNILATGWNLRTVAVIGRNDTCSPL